MVAIVRNFFPSSSATDGNEFVSHAISTNISRHTKFSWIQMNILFYYFAVHNAPNNLIVQK